MLVKILHACRGAAIGLAEVIPGVSGGTLAFITGIYYQLIESIKSFDLEFFGLLLSGKFIAAWEKVNGKFLLPLLLGMLVGLVIGILLISELLESHPPVVWGFFFGLILASSWYILRRIEGFNLRLALFVGIGTLIAYGITTLSPAEGSSAYPAIFLSGSIAICALILPGISGSFILLLMGMYTMILSEARSFIQFRDFDALLVLIVFVAGALLGLLVFTRLISWLLNHYQKTVYALLCGFMIGSLNAIWPWRDPVLFLDAEGNIIPSAFPLTGDFKVLQEVNKWPADYMSGPAFTVAVILAFIVGVGIVLVMDQIEIKNGSDRKTIEK